MLNFSRSFKRQAKLILKVVKNDCQKVAKEDTCLEELKNLMIHMERANTANIEKLCGK